jgi:two-component system response regulator YesN
LPFLEIEATIARVMRLLIVDDEFYTRQGILSDLDFRALGIDDVAEADDGLNALEVARSLKPDIVLADVRMPRMDGVAMSIELRKAYPRCRIVFMSGHADKEYLKGAIEVGALRYIEKPFRTEELREALEDAVRQLREEARLRASASAGDPLLRSEIAAMLIEPHPDDGRLEGALEAAGLSFLLQSQLRVALLRGEGARLPADSAFRARFQEALAGELDRASMGALATFVGDEQIALVLYSSPGRSRAPAEREVGALCSCIFSRFPELHFLAGIGAAGTEEGRASYESARSALDRAFFLGAGEAPIAPAVLGPCPAAQADIDAFQGFLDREDGAGAKGNIRELCSRMRAADTVDAKGARDALAGIALRLVAYAERRGVEALQSREMLRVLTEEIERRGTLAAIESLLAERIDAVFGCLEERREGGRLVAAIRQVIHRRYAQASLDLAGVAAEVKLSEAHICRLYKEQTGGTIHGYLVEYRLERAKELLGDPRLPKMTDVAARTGFSDAAYFARVFRKAVGMSPSEYREWRLS